MKHNNPLGKVYGFGGPSRKSQKPSRPVPGRSSTPTGPKLPQKPAESGTPTTPPVPTPEPPPPSLPDLTVTLLFATGTFVEGELVTFTAVVKNIGLATAVASTTRFKIDGVTFDDVDTPELASGASTEVISQEWVSTAGAHDLTATADALGIVTETSEFNNTRSTRVTIEAIPPPALQVYPKGIWSFFGPGDILDPRLIANKGVVGLVVGANWSEVNPSDGVYDWTALDAKIAQCKTNGFKVVLNIINSSLATPEHAKVGTVTIPLLDPSPGHPQTFCYVIDTPLFWDAVYHQRRKDLAIAAGAHYANDTSIIGVTIGFANYHSNDFNFTDFIGTVQCPTCPGSPPQLCGPQVVDQPQQWLDAGYTETKMAIVGEELLDTYAAAFPNQYLKVPIGGLAPQLLTDYSQLARDLENRIFGSNLKSYANRVSFQRNSMNAKWEPGTTYDTFTPPFNSDKYIRYMIRKHVTGFYHLAGLQSVDTATGGFPECRQGGGPTGPCGVNCDALCVIQKSIEVAESFGVTYYEIFVTDGRNPAFDATLRAATVAMGGTIRP